MTDKITLEDINTILLKFDNSEVNMHSAPHITVSGHLLRGNVTSVDGLISLPDDNIEYDIYYQGKRVDEIELPRDAPDYVQVRVVTKSYEPYVGVDVLVNIFVMTPIITNINDLNTYKYGCPSPFPYNIEGEVNNDILIEGDITRNMLQNWNITINGEVTFKNIIQIRDSSFIINNELTVNDIEVNLIGDYFTFINNGRLTLNNIEIANGSQGVILNNNHLEVYDSNFVMDSDANQPVIHSTTDDIILKGNIFNCTNATGYGVCIIRANDYNTDQFLLDNTTDYDCTYTNDDTEYTVTGNGIAYCRIDEDTIYFKQLEVTSE